MENWVLYSYHTYSTIVHVGYVIQELNQSKALRPLDACLALTVPGMFVRVYH